MADKRIPKRSEIPEEFTWDLSDMYPSDEAWKAEYEALKEMPARLEAFRGHLGDSAETLLEFFRLQDELELRLMPLHTYASCSSDADTADGVYQDMVGKAYSSYVAIASAGAFATPEIMAIDEDRLNLFYVAQPELETYRRSIYRIRRRAAHILSGECEALLASAGEIAETPDKIGSVFRNADIRFDPAKDEKGEEHPLTNGTFVPLLESADRTLRRSAFEQYYSRMGAFRNTLAAALNGEFRQRLFFSRARRYPDTLSAALDVTEVPTEVYTNLIEAVHANLDKMYRYVALRKKLLGVDELHMWDVYTPIVGGTARKIDFEEAKATVLEALAVLGEDYTALLREGFDNRWIDVYENAGKCGGAYSSGFARPHPYVLLNQKDTLDSMFTLAHEMGHAMHSYHDQFGHCGHPGGTADQHDVVDVGNLDPGLGDHVLERLLGALEQISGQFLELRTGQLLVQVHRSVRGDREVLQRDVGAGGRGEFLLGLLGSFAQTLQRDLVLGQVDALDLELVQQVVDDPLIPVVAAQAVVAGRGADLDRGETVVVLADFQQRDVEGAATEVEDQDEFVFFAFVQAIGQRRGSGLVDDAQHVQAGDLTGFFGGLALGVVEVGGNRDHRVGDLFAQVGLGVVLELHQGAGGDFLRGVLLVVDADGPVGAHVALDRGDGAIDVVDGLALGDFADQDFTALGERDD